MDNERPKIVVITGACGGMGRACLKLFAPRAKIIAVDIDRARVDALVAEFQAEGHDVVGTTCDITSTGAVADLAAMTARLGTPLALIHTAGLSPSMGNAQRIMEVNLVATQRLVDAFYEIAVPGFAAVLISSMAPYTMAPDEAAAKLLRNPLAAEFWTRLSPFCDNTGTSYAYSKWGVIEVCAREALRWGGKGARINSLAPGTIDTPMSQLEKANAPETFAMLVKMCPVGRFGRPDEIASAIEFLCSDAASFISGIDLLVDGGAIATLRQARREKS